MKRKQQKNIVKAYVTTTKIFLFKGIGFGGQKVKTCQIDFFLLIGIGTMLDKRVYGNMNEFVKENIQTIDKTTHFFASKYLFYLHVLSFIHN